MSVPKLAACLLTFLAAVCCTPEEKVKSIEAGTGVEDPVVSVAEDIFIPSGDIIPDFSSVGYGWGEVDYPSGYPTVKELDAPSGEDDTELIQRAIDEAAEKTVIKFRTGTYRVRGTIALDKSRVILRGDPSGGTTILATGIDSTDIRDLIVMGRTTAQGSDRFGTEAFRVEKNEEHAVSYTVYKKTVNSTERKTGHSSKVTEDAFCGARWLKVDDPGMFDIGDRVVVLRPATDEWISAIHMNEIVQAAGDLDVFYQWNPGSYNIRWERFITAVRGDYVCLDAPIVMSLTAGYGGEGKRGRIHKASWDRITGSGIEYLRLESEYDKSYVDAAGNPNGKHAWAAVNVKAAEHCWIKDVKTKYFAQNGFILGNGAFHVTIDDCSDEPAGPKQGGMRYGFPISSGECCLVKNCESNYDSLPFVTSQRDAGPNVFWNCTAYNAKSVVGPHERWATGTLYDNVVTNGPLQVQDAGNYGSGHGWQGANIVFWGCTTGEKIVCQSPWESAVNYVIGCRIGDTPVTSAAQLSPGRSYPAGDTLGERPQGICRGLEESEPQSLYEWQLASRKERFSSIISGWR